MTKQYLQHPLSAAYPSMTEDEFRGLVEDMRKHGQRDVATLYDGMVLDGWHRYSACVQIGIPCRFEDFSGKDPVAFVISKNTHRRQFSASQRAAAVVAVHAWRPANSTIEGRQTEIIHKGAALHPSLSATKKQMAAEASVSERTIVQAKRAHEAGLIDPIRDGEISVERAAEIAKLPKREQKAAIADPTIKPEPKLSATIAPALRVIEGGKDATELEAARARIAELEAENEVIREASEGLQAENEKLCALVDLESEPAKLIADLQKRLVRAQTTLSAAEIQRDNFQRENAQLKSEVKRLRRTAA